MGRDGLTVKPSAKPTLVRTQHLPPPAKTATGLGIPGLAGRLAAVLWVPKTRATWPDALLAAGHSGPASGTCESGLGLPGRGMIFGLWA